MHFAILSNIQIIVLYIYPNRIILQVIPALAGDATEQTPPDLPSYLFKERIVYLGMSLVPAVTELMLAELLYLQYDNPTRPIYMYINSTGVAVRVKTPGTLVVFL